MSVSRVFFAIAHTNAWRNGAGREREGGKLLQVKETRGRKGKGKRWVKMKEENLSGRGWNLPFDIVKCKRTYAALWRIFKSQHCDH